MATLQIYGLPPSTYVRTSRMSAHEKGVDHELVHAAPHTPDLTAISPFGKMPAMRHGDVTLFESHAINTYIDRTFDGPPLTPADPKAYARMEEWVSAVNTAIDPLMVRKYLFAYIFPGTEDGKPDRARIDASLEELDRQIGILDAALADSDYLAGGSLSLADLNLLPIIHYCSGMPESGEKIKAAGNLAAWLDRMNERDSVQATMPPRGD